ncbi:MAG: TetR/AcrR family transcriptional regulator [Myxococcota bacterium]|jgi:AcrR family transcriptional regulator|nr:TetR/AcrR family transcriptional regulator [Myxococcota bacterium]
MSVNPSQNSSAPKPSSRTTAGERARAATRTRLLESGRTLFAENGLHRVTSHDIAAHAGVAAGTFYNHFSDKAALFREITDEALRELMKSLESAADAGADHRQEVRQRASALVGFAAENRELIRILFSRETDATTVQSDVLQHMASRASAVRKSLIHEGSMPAEIDPEVFGQALIGMWARVVAWWAEDTDRASREVVIETLTQIQLHGTHPNHNDPE